jgi:hypothetical protein
MASKSNKTATFLPVDGNTITMYNNGNKGERHVQMFSKSKFGIRSNEI